MPRRPLILSASRRTDLPGCYPDRLVDRLTRRVRGFRVYELYGVVLWSKHISPFLDHPRLSRLLRVLANPVVNLTVTGLGGSRLEPGVPRAEEVLRRVPELVRGPLRGQAARLRWRFDPIWPRPDLLHEFRALAEVFAAEGVPTCTVSFPTRFSQRGSMLGRYRRWGLQPPSPALQEETLRQIASEARARGMRVLACAQPELQYLVDEGEIEPGQCIPREVLVDLHPEGKPFPDLQDPSQRVSCTCLPSEDLGRYAEDRCRCGCVYCYSRAGGPDPEV